ncbi:MAG: PrsW family intramembrane metalloprotease [Lachnospiraceae bacterium]|nr:PrsW family intramembrane metalloprotease [Lachnospiraceae bacterium]
MSYIENIYICLAAPILLCIFCFRSNARRSLIFVLSGMTACLFSAYVSAYLTGVLGLDMSTASHEVSPMVEEVLKLLPVLFYLMVFEPKRGYAISSPMLVAVGFATFENVCFLTSYGSADLLRLVIRGFGTGAMHVVCGMTLAVGLFFLWDQLWLRAVGLFALLCFLIRFHAIFNLFVNQSGAVFWIGSAIPLTVVLLYILFFRKLMEKT